MCMCKIAKGELKVKALNEIRTKGPNFALKRE